MYVGRCYAAGRTLCVAACDRYELMETIPVLASLDLQATEGFYRRALGFQDFEHYGDYLLARHGSGIELHFWLTDNPEFPANTSCYLRGGEIDRLHAEWVGSFSPGNDGRLSPIMQRAWGMTEFYVHDVHGNLLRFGRSTSAC